MNDLFNILQDLPLDNKIFIRSCVDKLERDIPGNLQGLDRAIESEGVEALVYGNLIWVLGSNY